MHPKAYSSLFPSPPRATFAFLAFFASSKSTAIPFVDFPGRPESAGVSIHRGEYGHRGELQELTLLILSSNSVVAVVERREIAVCAKVWSRPRVFWIHLSA